MATWAVLNAGTSVLGGMVGTSIMCLAQQPTADVWWTLLLVHCALWLTYLFASTALLLTDRKAFAYVGLLSIILATIYSVITFVFAIVEYPAQTVNTAHLLVLVYSLLITVAMSLAVARQVYVHHVTRQWRAGNLNAILSQVGVPFSQVVSDVADVADTSQPAADLEATGGAPVADRSAGQRAHVVVETQCSICLETYEPTDDVLVFSCRHFFHRTCVSQWASGHPTCPICRQSLLPGEDADAHAANGVGDTANLLVRTTPA
jgi:hypothetical protein